MYNIDDFNYLLQEETNKLNKMTNVKKVVTHFELDDMPQDIKVCKQLLYIMINNYWFQKQNEVISKIRQRIPNINFYQIFSSLDSYHRFMCLCVKNDLIEEHYENGIHLNRITLKTKKGRIMTFARMLKEFLIDRPENAIYGLDISLLKRLIGMGCAVRCPNQQSLLTSFYRL